MTLKELLAIISTIEDVRTHFKWLDDRLVLIFWRGHSPIASVFVDGDTYNKDYPKLYEMNLYDLFKIDYALYDFTQTPVENRELNV